MREESRGYYEVKEQSFIELYTTVHNERDLLTVLLVEPEEEWLVREEPAIKCKHDLGRLGTIQEEESKSGL